MQDLRTTLAFGASALALSSVLCAHDLWRLAERQPLSPRRDLGLSILRPLRSLNAALRLDRPARWLRPRLYPDALPPEIAPAPIAQQAIGNTTVRVIQLTPPDAPGGLRLRAPTPDRPWVLWVGGDSTAQRLGEELVTLATATGFIRASHDSQHSTGLTRPDYFDWNARFSRVLSVRHPDVMVVALGANDAERLPCSTGPCEVESPEWTALYRQRVDRAMNTLRAVSRVVWLTLPPMRSEVFARRAEVINAAFRAEALRHPNVVLLDTALYVATPQRTFSAYLTDARGRTVMVRETDGIHCTRDGARRIAEAVMQGISAQATPEQPLGQ